jgi:hypothetical protein
VPPSTAMAHEGHADVTRLCIIGQENGGLLINLHSGRPQMTKDDYVR